MSGGAGPADAPRPGRFLPRYLHRVRRAHDLADRPAGDTNTLLRKARAVFMLRARQLTWEAERQRTGPGEPYYRSAAARELGAARLMHRLIMARSDVGSP